MRQDELRGYDSALTQKRNDDLGRWRFASEIAEVIRSTPPEWSARIGIFGKWGEGKSTVLHFLEGMLRPENNIVFSFNPWAIQNLDEMWSEFGTKLLEALHEVDLLVEPGWKSGARAIQKKIQDSGFADLGEGAAGLFGKDKIVKSAFGVVGNWLKPDGPQIKKIRERLENRRVVVFIDDLDRATPELLPKLLLSLREILDLPAFTFVLAFDNEIVANGLITFNGAWGDGANFLDKILDFHYYLPPVSKEGKRQLLKRMLDRYCKFVPIESIEPIEKLLPDNPRKLKILIRSLISLKPQLERHGEEELDWPEIWLAEMVRQESYSFFMRLLDGDTLDELAGIGYKIKKKSSHNLGQTDSAADVSDIEELFKEVGNITSVQSKRLIELISATRSIAGLRLQYNWRFALRPEAVTWKEFRELLSRWNADSQGKTISDWVSSHAETNSIDRGDIERELFDTLLNAKHNASSEAANASASDDNARYSAEAAQILKMTEQFLRLPKMLMAERFGMLYGKCMYWIAFRINEPDKSLRETERKMLLSLLRGIPERDAPEFLRVLAPWDGWAFAPEDPNTVKLKKQLRDECVALVLPKVELSFASSLAKADSIRMLLVPESSPAYIYILFNPERLPWSRVVRQSLLSLARGAQSDAIQYRKIIDLFRLLIDASQNRIPYIAPISMQLIASDKEFISALWLGVTARSIQFRMLNLFLSYRLALIGLGMSETELPLPPELEVAAQRSQGDSRNSVKAEEHHENEDSDIVDLE